MTKRATDLSIPEGPFSRASFSNAYLRDNHLDALSREDVGDIFVYPAGIETVGLLFFGSELAQGFESVFFSFLFVVFPYILINISSILVYGRSHTRGRFHETQKVKMQTSKMWTALRLGPSRTSLKGRMTGENTKRMVENRQNMIGRQRTKSNA